MAYIGKIPLVGNYTVLDSLTATTTDTYALTKNSVAVYPQTPANCIVSLNGVIQAPFDSYTISGSNIVFASALTASDSIDFITVLGDVLNVGTVSDDTITTAKIQNGAITSAKLASGVGGKVLQVVTATDSTQRSTTSTSYVTGSNTLSVSITPSSASSKILVFVTSGVYGTSGTYGMYTIFRDSTNLAGASNEALAFSCCGVANSMNMHYLDSPSSTSALTYEVRMLSGAGQAVYLQFNAGNGARGIITAMEIAG